MGTQNRFEEAIKNNREKLLVKILTQLSKECLDRHLIYRFDNKTELANIELCWSNAYNQAIQLIKNDKYLVELANELKIIL